VPASANPVRAAVVDFDGTICRHDVSEEILRAFATPEWMDIDIRFQRGEIGSRECLVRQGALLEGTRRDMLRYALDRYAIDPTFAPFVAWAQDVGIEVAVASDGLGFYIEPMLRSAGVAGISILTNEVTLVPGERPSFFLPNAHPVCVGCGTCKMQAVLSRRDRLGPVAFVGEGHSDRYGALYADVVFAKKHLVDICRADGVTFHPWETFDDVRTGLESMNGIPEWTGPERCPGWKTP
jgi:2-hydroxy-3-keto-5-methylthiopentenyl-1-phosphate phosphatase